MVVSVFTALLDKGDLIDARILEALEMRAELVGRANPTRGAGLGQRGSRHIEALTAKKSC